MIEDETKAETNIEDERRSNAQYALAFAALLAFVILIAALMLMNRGTTKDITLHPETPRQAYLKILGETHTGLRLVRLDDFIANTAPNANISSAKTARDALATNEQIAWAKLTHALYDLDSNEVQKTQALDAYKTIWGIWSRQQDLPKLIQATMPPLLSSTDAQYAPNTRRSKFRKDNPETMLAGPVPTAIIIQKIVKTEPPKRPKVTIQEPRIKYAKRPRYPRRARRKGIEAVVTLSLSIDARGNVARTQVVSVRAERYKDNFVRAARRAAMASNFHPKTVGGRPVSSQGYIRKYTFGAEK